VVYERRDFPCFRADQSGVQGFICVNHLTGFVWALFVIDEAQGRGHGTQLLDAAMARLREAGHRQSGHRQSFLLTGSGTKAAGFYRSKAWQPNGHGHEGRGGVSTLAVTKARARPPLIGGAHDVSSLKTTEPRPSIDQVRRGILITVVAASSPIRGLTEWPLSTSSATFKLGYAERLESTLGT
jgi:Acetyltransferase (GNAT) domain